MRPHVLYVTPIFGYPAFGGPRLRTYNTLRALARCADVSLYVTGLIVAWFFLNTLRRARVA